jgi:hypothetical protein
MGNHQQRVKRTNMTAGTTSDTKITSENPNEVGELKDAELEKVVGGTAAGKPTPGSLSFSHYYDQSSPTFM